MRSLSRLLGASVLALSVTASGLAFGGDTSTAEHLFQQGLDAMKRNQFKEACDAFGGSNEADASPGTEINLALCNEKQGKLATAWGWYRTAAGLADLRNQKERAELARAEAAKLEPKLHKLVISVKSPVEGMTVTRNAATVPAAVLGTEVPIDPGDHAIEVNAKGKKPWKQTVHIAAGPGIDRVDVPAFEELPAEAKPAAGVPGADHAPPATGGRDGTAQRNIGFVVGGAGIIAGVVAVGLELLAIRTDDKRKESETAAAGLRPSLPISPNGQQAASYDSAAAGYKVAARNDEIAAIVTGAGAVVMIGVGITLVLTAPSASRSADLTKPRLYPVLGQGTAGLGLSGSF